jgi:aminoglycoside 3-N-acetyltransferase
MRLLKALYFRIHEKLPRSMGDRVLSYWARSPIRRALRRRRAAGTKAAKAEAIAKYGKAGTVELARVLRESGIEQGDVVFFQCSFNDLYTLDCSPLELIRMLEDVIGTSGTLLMPAYTYPPADASRPFRPSVDPTATGIVSEVFRRSEGVIRSLHPRHSICGRGPMAEQILAHHEDCARADGPDSPFDRMRRFRQAKVLTLGLPIGHISFLHWVEDFEPEKLPFVLYQATPVSCPVETADGRIVQVLDWRVRSDVASRMRLDRVFRRVSSAACKFGQFKGIAIGVYPMMPLASELLALRDAGLIHYH